MSNWRKIFGDNKPQVTSKDKDIKEEPPKVEEEDSE